MSRFLIDDRPLIVLPSLAKLLGSIERALVLQQIHWLSQQPKSGVVDDDGNKWVWGTLKEWSEDYFSMWSAATLKYHFRWLRENDYIIVEQLSRNKWDKTNYYRINYSTLEKHTAQKGVHPTLSVSEHISLSKGEHINPSVSEEVNLSDREEVNASDREEVNCSDSDEVNPSPTETSTKTSNTETSTKTSTDKTLVTQQAASHVDEIFNHWREVMNHPRSRMDAKRKKLINDAIKTGYTTDDLKLAITGCSKTPHNMGQNDNGQRYDGLHIILKSADQIDRFIQNSNSKPVKPNGGGSTRFPDSYDDKVYTGTPIEDLPWLMEAMAEEEAKEAAEAENAKH